MKTTFKRDFEMRYGVSPETLDRNTDATEPNTRADRHTVTPLGKHTPRYRVETSGNITANTHAIFDEKLQGWFDMGTGTWRKCSWPEAEARAIAAILNQREELLTACQRLIGNSNVCECIDHDACAFCEARAAIAKAEGKEFSG